MGGTGHAGFMGGTPVVGQLKGNPETLKYGKMWERDEYRQDSPGEALATHFMQLARPKAGTEVIDFGCGTGRGGFMIAVLGQHIGIRVTLIDFVKNCLDEDVRNALTTQKHVLRFIKADLERPIPAVAEYGFCCDVMEHIPPDKVTTVLQNILLSARHVFFNISTREDHMGQLIGETLHLTVQPYAWWLEQFQTLGCAIHYSAEAEDGCAFYVSGWSKGEDTVEVGGLNTTEQVIFDNVKANLEGGWQQLHPHAGNEMEVMIVGGGPSAFLELERIRAFRRDGVKLITLNGAYNWALEHGLVPSATVVCDARPFNARFTKPVVDNCKYLIASQCDPSVFEGLPKDRTWMWHTSNPNIYDLIKTKHELAFPIPGGSTVLLRTIPMFRQLGYKRFHLFGCDSCVATLDDGRLVHHAYQQPENDNQEVIPVSVEGRMFGCTSWMLSQAQEFQDLIRWIGSQIELEIYGDGILACILKTLAERDEVQITPTTKSEGDPAS